MAKKRDQLAGRKLEDVRRKILWHGGGSRDVALEVLRCVGLRVNEQGIIEEVPK